MGNSQLHLKLSSIFFAFAQIDAFAPLSLHHVWARLMHSTPSYTSHYAIDPYQSNVSEYRCFGNLGLSDDLVSVTEKMGWASPTAVQQLSIPSILELASVDGPDRNSLWCEVSILLQRVFYVLSNYDEC